MTNQVQHLPHKRSLPPFDADTAWLEPLWGPARPLWSPSQGPVVGYGVHCGNCNRGAYGIFRAFFMRSAVATWNALLCPSRREIGK